MHLTSTVPQKHYSTFGQIQGQYAIVKEEEGFPLQAEMGLHWRVSLAFLLNAWIIASAGKAEKRKLAAQNITEASKCDGNKEIGVRVSNMGLTSIPRFVSPFFIANLKTLVLDNNAIRTFPVEITSLTELTHLGFSGNLLEEIPSSIKKLKKLEYLSVAGNHLKTLPEAIGELIQLVVLHVSRNKLTTLPNTIGKLVNLKSLWAHTNEISSLPVEIGKLHASEIILYNNKLTSLPKEIGNVKELWELGVSDNLLESLPEDLGRLVQLHKLHVYNNPQLHDFPKSIVNCFHLGSIEIAGTNITLEKVQALYQQWTIRKELAV